MINHKPFLIGLAGPAGGGKDTAYKTIDRLLAFRQGAVRVAFADPIKAGILAIYDGWTREMLENRELKEKVDPVYGVSPRRAAQLLGTEYGREMINENLWALIAQNKIDRHIGDGRVVVVTDVRFENEAKQIKLQGGTIVRVNPDVIQAVSNHKSETPIPDIYVDYEVENSFKAPDGLQRFEKSIEEVLLSMGVISA